MEPEGKRCKEDLWKEKNEYVRSILEIPEIVEKEDERHEKVLAACISLKRLFLREEMDEHHVDCLVLYQIALKVLHIMEELSRREVRPGLYDLADFYVSFEGGIQVYLLHPERFQIPPFEQDYEWYPEDERVFGEITLFDEDAQKKADCRLIYKILVASCRGNVTVPPRDIRADYSSLFYKTLSPELKSVFLQEEGASHEKLKAFLKEAIALEKESARKVRERRNEQVAAAVRDSGRIPGMSLASEQDPAACPSQERKTIYFMYVLLRTETAHSAKISRLIYKEQDQRELADTFSGDCRLQAFVYGNGFVQAREFRSYPEGFRVQLEQSIREYSSAETIIIACELMDKKMQECITKEAPVAFSICLITDGRLKNDRMFNVALERLQCLKEQGCSLTFIRDPASACEACDRLARLCAIE